MTDKTPSQLTSSLLARKGDAAPSEEPGAPDSAAMAESPPLEPGPESVSGTPIADPPDIDETQSFLSQDPDPILPDPEPAPLNWDEEVSQEAEGKSRGGRAPMIALAVLLVFALAGVAWFAANMLLDGGPDSQLAASKKTLVPVNANGTSPSAQPNNPGMTAGKNAAGETVMPPSATDPVTSDPQDAPRLSSQQPSSAPEPSAQPQVAAAPLPPAVKPPPAPMVKAPPAPMPNLKPPVAATATPKPVPKPMVNPPISEPVQSVETPPTPKPPVTKAAAPPPKPKQVASRPTGRYAVQLSSVNNQVGARKELFKLSRRLASVLGGTRLRIQNAKLSGRGTVYRIKTAGGMSSRQAKKLCGAIKTKKQTCFVTAR